MLATVAERRCLKSLKVRSRGAGGMPHAISIKTIGWQSTWWVDNRVCGALLELAEMRDPNRGAREHKAHCRWILDLERRAARD